MKQHRASAFADAVLLDGRGQRDHLLREAARRYCAGMSDRAAAAMLRSKLARYRECAWRRDRSEVSCPLRHRGTITEVLWHILRARDAVPSERSIRRILALAHAA